MTGCGHLLRKKWRQWRKSDEGSGPERRRLYGVRKKSIVILISATSGESLTAVYESICCTVCVRIVIICRRRVKRLTGIHAQEAQKLPILGKAGHFKVNFQDFSQLNSKLKQFSKRRTYFVQVMGILQLNKIELDSNRR